ncbi:MAG: hypothetical protein WC521_06085 [Bdellovibrionales bacterium]
MNNVKREPLDPSDSKEKIIEILSEGNKEAKEILTKICDDPFLDEDICIRTLDEMNIRGVQIVAGYEYCVSLPAFIVSVRDRSKRMVDAINRNEKCAGLTARTGDIILDRENVPDFPIG